MIKKIPLSEDLCKAIPKFWIIATTSEEIVLEKTYNCNVRFIAHFKNYNYHRVDGPALQWFVLDSEPFCEAYYILGTEITKEQFETPGFIDAFILEKS